MPADREFPVDFFLHIPRSGGSSLRTLLSLNYPKDRSIALSGQPDQLSGFLNLPLEARKSYRLIHGHFPFGLHAGLGKFRYFTLIRDPVSRHFSEFYYARKHAHHQAYDRIESGELTLDYWAEIGEHHAIYHNNAICQYLSGDYQLNKPTYATFQAACSNLEKFHVFGLTDKFHESALMIAKYMGWKLPVYGKRNVIMGNTPIPKEILEKARRNLEWDIALYEYACELFDRRMRAESKAIYPALESYRQKVSEASGDQDSVEKTYLVGHGLDDSIRQANVLDESSPIRDYLNTPKRPRESDFQYLPKERVLELMKVLEAAEPFVDLKIWNRTWVRVWWLGLMDVRHFPNIYHVQYGWFTFEGKDDKGDFTLGFHDHRVGRVITNWYTFPVMRDIQSGQERRFFNSGGEAVRLEVLNGEEWEVLADPFEPIHFSEESAEPEA